MKKPICPICKSTNIARIVYGMPAHIEAWQKDIDAGKIELGGCVRHDDEPKWSCNGCGNLFRRSSTKEKKEVS